MIGENNKIDKRFLRMLMSALAIEKTEENIQKFGENFISCIREQLTDAPRLISRNVAIQVQVGEIVLFFQDSDEGTIDTYTVRRQEGVQRIIGRDRNDH